MPDYRGSISTDRTSASQGDTEEIVETRRVRLPQRPKGTYRLSDFIIQRTLGTGSFGRVHLGMYYLNRVWSFRWSGATLVRSKHNLRFYAVKVLNKERIYRMKQIEHTNNEQRMLQSVQHSFIINLWGVFQDAGNLYMVMDFVPGGELFTLLRRSNVFHFQNIRINYRLITFPSASLILLPSFTQLKLLWH
jgi:serine/threonine protein kinase